MIILVINCGSSSIKYQLLDMKSDDVYDIMAKGIVEKIGLPEGILTHKPTGKKNLVKEYPGLNHLFQHCTTGLPTEYAGIEETISEEVLGDIATWINGL